MKKARIAELKNNLSRYLEHVRGGGSVLVLDRDRPIAQLAPLTRTVSTTGAVRERLKRLEHRGLIRRGTGGRPAWLGRHRPVRLRGSVLRDLLRERETGWGGSGAPPRRVPRLFAERRPRVPRGFFGADPAAAAWRRRRAGRS